MLRDARRQSVAREAEIVATGYPAYTTSAGWLGYDDAKVELLVREAIAAGFTHVKMKVGTDLASDDRRAALIRARARPGRHPDDGREPGVGRRRGDRGDADARRARTLVDRGADEPGRRARPRERSAREIAPVRVATGEHVQNRVVFKQLFQAEAIDFCQLDACRVGGVNEAISVLLLAAKFGVPVCPHAGGVGLCEYVQHLAFFDYISVSGSTENRVVEWVDHLHEHFRDPAIVRDGRYLAPTAPGYSIEMLPESLEEFAFPHGPGWTDVALPVREE